MPCSSAPGAGLWSSHDAYLGGEGLPWLTSHAVFEQLAPDGGGTEPVSLYRELMVDEYRGGYPGTRTDEDFFAWLKARDAARRKPASLEEVIVAYARYFELEVTSIASRARSPVLSLARSVIAWSAVQNGVASLSEVARRLGRSRSSLHEIREMYRALAPEAFEKPLRAVQGEFGTSAQTELQARNRRGRAQGAKRARG